MIIVTGVVNIAAVLAAMLLLGIAEVFADTASQTLLPMVVDHDDLGLGNARLAGGFLVGNQIVGPPLGAFLFAARNGRAVRHTGGARWAVGDSRCADRYPEGTGVTSRHPCAPRHRRGRPVADSPRRRPDACARHRRVQHHVRRGWAVLVLYALDHLHMSEVGFGFLSTAAAIGGLLTTALYGRIERRFDLGDVMRVCLLLEVCTHLAFALTTNGIRRDGDHVRVRRLCLRLVRGVHRPSGNALRRWSCRVGLAASIWSACSAASFSGRHSAAGSPALGFDGTVLVRVRGLGHHSCPCVATAFSHRPH